MCLPGGHTALGAEELLLPQGSLGDPPVSPAGSSSNAFLRWVEFESRGTLLLWSLLKAQAVPGDRRGHAYTAEELLCCAQ